MRSCWLWRMPLSLVLFSTAVCLAVAAEDPTGPEAPMPSPFIEEPAGAAADQPADAPYAPGIQPTTPPPSGQPIPPAPRRLDQDPAAREFFEGLRGGAAQGYPGCGPAAGCEGFQPGGPSACGPAAGCGTGWDPGRVVGSYPLQQNPRRGLLQDGQLNFGGWLAQGATVNGWIPQDRFNGPVTFNDRDGEYQMNQFWLYAEKTVDTRRRGWDVGGRVDLMYGTDWRFTRSFGLEDDWNESERFYGAAFPQAYLDAAVGPLSVRMGHFFTIIGYEVVPAPDNFFYSHAYTHQYGEPFTHTGALATLDLGGGLTVSSGFDRGWDNWEDNNHHLSYLGGIGVNSADGRASLTFALSTGPYDDAGDLNRTMYSIVYTNRVTPRVTYVFQHDWGLDNDGGPAFFDERERLLRRDAEWYGINQYVTWQINPCLAVGLRSEWFRDEDGTRVAGIGAPHGWTLGPGWAGDFYELTLGVNWSPWKNVRFRPELRWDWYDGPRNPAGNLPYNFGEADDQFTYALDMIVMF